MLHTKTMLAALATLALLPTAATAARVYATDSGMATVFNDVTIKVSSHCGYWGAETGVVGSYYWNVTIWTTGVVCNGSGSGNHNEVKYTSAEGWTFRQWHFIKTSDSYDRTCDRCQIGDIGGTGNVTGPTVRFIKDKSGTRDTSWYSGYVTNLQQVSRGDTLGYI
jgi:hypothetical protein